MKRPSLDADEALRLEGVVVQKRMSKLETTRYLVIDFNSGAISMYRKPPPKDGSALAKRRSAPMNLMSTLTSSLPLSRSSSDGAGCKDLTCENLAHMSRNTRQFARGEWDPKFHIPPSVKWQLRDVENDETMFYLVLPPDFKAKDSEAEVVSVKKVGNHISYRHLNQPQSSDLGSINEGEEAGGDYTPSPSGRRRASNASDYSDDNSSVSSVGSKKKSSLLSRTFNQIGAEHEIIYQFRVLLDGNEKFIWLQAAAELGRLCSTSAVNLTSATVDVTKKLLLLPMITGGGGRSKLTALRYAEWARHVDQKKNVSQFRFDVHDLDKVKGRTSDQGNPNPLEDSARYDSTRLVKVIPTYAYRNRRMTEKDLYYEMTTESEKWEDFRKQVAGDRQDQAVGSLHVEILACHGLPKLDRLSQTDAVCYVVCGPFAFATDVIDGFLSPVWPSKSRRACIFPLFYAYQKLYVGVFDDDGEGAHDDFAGRVVVDVARLRPHSEYDVFLPLRLYQNAFVKKARGVIHLRLRVEWDNERKALLSYLKRPQKTELLGNALTVNCADLKAFRNVVLTVQGKDVPGRLKPLVQKGLQREMKLYKFVVKTTMKEEMMDIVLYINPSVSLCIFVAWMHCVYSNSMAYVPVYFVAGIIALLMRNYFKYGVDQDFHFGFSPITVTEMLKVLLWGGEGTKYIKPIKVARQNDSKSLSGLDEPDGENEDLMTQSVFSGVGFRMDGDHMEFPFSEAGRYPKKTLSEACVDASAMFLEDDDEQAPPGKFASLRLKAKKSTGVIRRPKANREDDDEEDDDEFGVLVKSSIPQQGGTPQDSIAEGLTKSTTGVVENGGNVGTEIPDKVWKRVSDPRGLPEQDATVVVKARKTLKEDLIHNKDLLHKYSQRLFDDRMFIIDETDGQASGEKIALNQAIGANKYKSPIMATIAQYAGPALEMLKVGLSVWRSGFNLFTWRDPFLTSLFFFGAVFLLCVLIVFPWRLFFFAMGFGAVGPQNWLLRVLGLIPKKKKKSIDNPEAEEGILKKRMSKKRSRRKLFQFHNHCATDQGIDVREERSKKSSAVVHRAVVPNSPLISRRFYDWPPNPSLSKVDIHED